MKRFITFSAALLFVALAYAQSPYYEFTMVKSNPTTSVKNQAQTGTCWSFATISFLESEAIKKGTADTSLNLSEMFFVRNEYLRRGADFYYRRGKGRKGPGGVSHQAIFSMEHNGLMTEEAYNGINYDSKTHNHKELQSEFTNLMDEAVKEKKGVPYEKASTILDKWLGQLPSTLSYKGTEYSPLAFKNKLKLNGEDYVEITSFMHHPYYEQFVLEIPDNYDMASYYNVPLDEFVAIAEEAIMKGYTIAWDADVSETYFAHNNHVAVFAPGENIKGEKEGLKKRYLETPVDAISRQRMFEDFTTTDDHLMHITGLVKDQNGVKYFMVKNSWGVSNGDGYLYVSENYFKAKTIAIMINKDALPKAIRKKLNIK